MDEQIVDHKFQMAKEFNYSGRIYTLPPLKVPKIYTWPCLDIELEDYGYPPEKLRPRYLTDDWDY